MMSELPLDQIRTLLAVVDEGSFDAAAQELRLTPSAVSQRIKALERRVGRVLVLRTKPVGPTGSGEVLVQLVRLEDDAAAELGLPAPDDGSGSGADGTGRATTLAVAVNADSLATWFLPALSRLPPELRVCFELHKEDQARTADLLRQGLVSAAITAAPHPVAGCTVRPLGSMAYRACATPEFVERWLAPGPVAQTLPSAPVIVFNRDDDLQDAFLRELAPDAGPGAGRLRHSIPASDAYVRAVAAGLGWGMLPDEQAAQLPPGTVVDLAPGRTVEVALYWQQWKLDSPPLAALAAAVAQAAAGTLTPPRRR
jgi:LysR family transcriptional regulator (chromosome initiation inhibitor)